MHIEWQSGQLLINDSGPFVTRDSILESITVCKVLCGGTVKETPSVSFCCAIFFFRKKKETGYSQKTYTMEL